MNQTQTINNFLNIVQESPNTFSFITLGIFCLCGYLLSVLCMKCLKKTFGNIEQGLSENQIKEIVEQQRQRRIKKNTYKSGQKKTLSAEEEAQIQKRVQIYKEKIRAMMEQDKKKKNKKID